MRLPTCLYQMKIPYFNCHQDPKRDEPEKFIEIEEARTLKKAKTHFFVNHGQALAEVPRSAFNAVPLGQTDVSGLDAEGRVITKRRGNWAIVGQTSTPAKRNYTSSWGPGCPQFSFV